MYKIEKTGTKFDISNYPWDEFGYKPRTYVMVSYDDNGFRVLFVSYETNITTFRMKNNLDICADSCMELFMQFDPKNDERYINIEVNSIGAAYNAVTLQRGSAECICDEDIALLDIKTRVLKDRWEITYKIPVSYIKKYIPTYEHKEGNIIRGNFYKCGDDSEYPHYGCFSEIKWTYPDFHRPEFFAEFMLA